MKAYQNLTVLVRLLPQNHTVLVRLPAVSHDRRSSALREGTLPLPAPLLLTAYTIGMKVEIAEYDARWPCLFQERGERLRQALGAIVLRIDHISSTSIPGLAAKPILDIQISVAALEPLAVFREPLEALHYVFRADNIELTKQYFRESLGTRREHVHVRKAGSWGEQFALLVRDYMRAHPDEAALYASLKRDLAERYRHDRHGYTQAKSPFIWSVMQRATDWSQEIGWEPRPSDVPSGIRA